MSTQYTVFKEGDSELYLDERSSDLYLNMDVSTLNGVINFESNPLTEDQIVEMAVALIGPAFYFTDDETALVAKFKAEMKRRGFARPNLW